MIEVTGQDFEKEVLECDIPVFACFTTHWCQPCFPTCLIADQLTEEYSGVVKFVRLDVEKSAEIAKGYNITAVPTILLFRNSLPTKTLRGFQDRNSLRDLLNSATSGNIKGEVKRLSGK